MNIYQVFSTAIYSRMGNNKNKKKAFWVKCKNPPIRGDGCDEIFPRNSHTEVQGWVTKIHSKEEDSQ
jgi:hypothetical protein